MVGVSRGMEGVEVRVGVDGVVLVLGALSNTPTFPVLVPCPKKNLGARVG